VPFKPLVTAGIENALNAFLYRAPALKTARQRLNGKVLRIVLKEFSTPLVLVFSERQLDVLGEWEGEADCSVITHMSVLPKLRDRQQLTALIRSGELEVEGDIQVVQNFVALSDLAEFDPAELLAPILATSPPKGSAKSFTVARHFCAKPFSASSATRQKC
jgi:ubiquinone biosynthesis protein UbiJ